MLWGSKSLTGSRAEQRNGKSATCLPKKLKLRLVRSEQTSDLETFPSHYEGGNKVKLK